MNSKLISILLLSFFLNSCKEDVKKESTVEDNIVVPELTFKEANRLAGLPLACLQIEYPNKLNQSLNDASHIASPKELHPAFYGCFDWHSSVHGHWSLVSLLKQYPSLHEAATIRAQLAANITAENIAVEIAYFKMEGNSSYERTYGWAWILKLAEELHTWEDPLARDLEKNLQPLTDLIVSSYLEFLPKLNYPIRVGEHTNTAFGLSLALDYAETLKNNGLIEGIKNCVTRFYSDDADCPLSWEPSGFDFLSPCLEEANLVRRIYSADDFKIWFDAFLPELTDADYELEPGKVSDRTDGKLVHLDGLNFSRAWCLYGIAETLPEYSHLKKMANNHISYSLPNIIDANYSGTHWLGSFALHALNNAK
ncbi:DUF2891 domain-containing protein [Cellulophaga sp. HaHaR_3_176]|uniref:DUF2891 domain-containing protein n=1 Tax=Cellulophaga sp. HaHaR_3_176 TaxID=1942464 RepID=UPI001C1F6DC4|nr:DUF2891 domain-containing protein [Cellulophaga sp. HaHaR_3_176]QWX82670.1 DUF2891 domain-containing protein [Cellulophaga sp. HaHaR_3_176]